jgi:general secretion pathway protein A
LLDLGQFLVSRGSKGLTTVLIVDEAHHLSEELLEEVRFLSNLETTDDKLLQIVLVGQPELDQKLDSVGLRQLKQRVALRAQLGPLDAAGDKGIYRTSASRCRSRGRSGPSVRSRSPSAAVYRHSRGFPRLINTVCENALIIAYARQIPKMSVDVVEDVAKEFRLDMNFFGRRSRRERDPRRNGCPASGESPSRSLFGSAQAGGAQRRSECACFSRSE